MKGGEEGDYPGVPRPREKFTRFPNALFDHLLGKVTPHEWMVLAYLVRLTYGYNCEYEGAQVSVRRVSTALRVSTSTVRKALNRMERKGILVVERRHRPDGGLGTSLYRFRFEDEVPVAFSAIGEVRTE